ncbi:MAG: hypothetical protein SGILL_002193 [Bacillariaceae sp.]
MELIANLFVFPYKDIGYKPGPVPGMTWLGAGDAVSSRAVTVETWYENTDRLVNNGAIYLPSLAQIPRTPTLLSKCRLVVKTGKQEDQEWVEAIWKNETQNLVFYVYGEQQCLGNNDYDGEIVDMVVTTDKNEPLIRYKGYPEDSRRREAIQFGSRLETLFHSFDDFKLFVARILHSFLRTHAHMLPLHVLWDLMTRYLGDTIGNLTSKKYKDDRLDWELLQTDLALNLPAPGAWFYSEAELAEVIYDRLMTVGQSLSSLGRFQEAAALYVDIGKVFPESYCLWMAAQSFYNVGDNDASLENYAKHLQRVMEQEANDPDWSDPNHESVLVGLIYTWHSIYERVAVGNSIRTRNRVVLMPQQATEAIGCLAMFKPLYGLFGLREGTNLSKCLKSEYSRAARAKRALAKVMKSGEIGEYKKLFANAMNPQTALPMLRTLDTTSSDEFRAENAERSRKIAQSLTKTGTIRRCAKCGADSKSGKLMACPCHKVQYCSKECQRFHWRFHKDACEWHLSKTEEATSGETSG